MLDIVILADKLIAGEIKSVPSKIKCTCGKTAKWRGYEIGYACTDPKCIYSVETKSQKA